MSATIDERVVEMRFDNKQFESNAKESLSTLEKLKQALNLSDSTKSFDNLTKAANGVDMNGLGAAVENVKLKFSALEIMAITALSNITNRAVDAGVSLVKSLSVDQITAGWDKYAEKTSSVQTIMAATAKDFEDTGEQMEYVNSQLDKLNWFTDETSYSFLDMVNNIGKFTSNNIPLEQSVTAMQGISTWAAISGANVQEASRAMYNLSQALAVGSVKLIDWKSIENANMATAEFKQTVIDTAVELGTLIEKGDGTYETLKGNAVSVSNFNEALSDAWFSADVLLATLEQYGGFTDKLYEASELTGLTATELLQAIDKYKDGQLSIQEFSQETGVSVAELTDMFEELSDEMYDLGERSFRAAQEAKTFQEAIDATKDAVSTGWMQTFEIIFGNYEEAKVLWTDFANFLYDVFASSAEMRNEILEGWKEAGGRDDLFDGIRAGWEALLSAIQPIKDAWDYIFPPKSEDERIEGLVALTRSFKELMEGMKLSDSTSDKLKRTFQGLFAIVDIVGQGLGALIRLVAPGVTTVGNLSGGILDLTASFGDWLVSIDEMIKENEWFVKGVEKVHEVLGIGIDKAKEFIGVIKEWVNSHWKAPDLSFITDFFDTVEFRFSPVKAVLDLIGKGIGFVLNLLSKAAPLIGGAASFIGKALSTLGSKIADAFTGGGFNAVLDLFNGGVMAAIGVGIADFIHNLSSVVKEGGGFLEGIKEIKDAVLDTFGAIQSQIKSKTLLNIAIAIGILTASLVVLSMIDSDKLGASLGVVTALFLDLFGSMAAFEKIMASSGLTSIKKISTSMIALSASILILASAMKKIASIDSDKLLGALGSVTLLLGEMTVVAIALSKWGGKINTGAVSIIAFATSIVILAQAVKQLADLDVDQLTKGLVSVGVLLAELAAFMFAAKFGQLKPSQATSLVILAASLLVLQKAVSAFGTTDAETLLVGIAAIGALLAELALFGNLAGYAKHMISTSVAMVIMAGALILLQKPMEAFGNMEWEAIGKGLVAMAGALLEVTLAMRLMPTNTIAIGLGLLEVSAALTIITKTLQSMGGMSWEEIGKGLTTLAIALAELTISMRLMTGTLSGAAAMMVMSAALLTLTPVLKILGGMEWGEIAKGLVALAGAFAVVGIAGALLGPIVPAILGLAGGMALLGIACAGVGIGILAFAAGLTALSIAGVSAAATVVAMLEILVVGLLNAIADSAEALGGALKAIILTLCDVIVSCVPEIVRTVLVVVKEVLIALAENAPDIVHALLQFIIGIIDALAADLPTVIQSVVNLFMSFFAGIIDALKGIDVNVLINGLAGIGVISALMLALAALAGLAPEAMIGVLAMGAVIAELALVLAAVGALAQIPGLKWLIGEGGDLLQGIGTAIGKFVGGIVGGFMSGVSAQFPQIGQDLSDFMTNVTPFIEGAKLVDAAAMEGVGALAKVILLLTAAEILDGLTSWFTGGSSIVDFGAELAEFGPHFAAYYDSVRGVDGGVVQASANAALALAEMASKLPNQGGVVGWFCGENSLAVFAEELTEFGPKLKAYADSVKGLDADVVVASANAALALAEMASKLPNQGGVVGWFVGENSLSVFAEELAEFGPVLKSYADSVRGLDPGVVEASASAALALAEMADNLPNQGGVVSWFTGDNTLSVFGEEISKFGPYIAQYAKDVAGLDGDVVVNSANAALALANLANNLPNSGGLVSWFTGDNDISTFGESLAKFGKSMTEYYNSVAGINTSQLDGVIVEVKKLIEIAQGTASIDTSGMTGFANSLKTMGNNGIDGFIQAFTDSTSKVTTAVNTMMNSAITAAEGKDATFKTTGQGSADSWLTGFKNRYNEAITVGTTIATKVLGALQLQQPNFLTKGVAAATQYLQGFKNKYGEATSTGTTLANNALGGLNAVANSFTTAGANAGQGFVNGLKSKINDAAAAGTALGNAAYNAAKKALDEHSPSKKMGEVGNYAGLGFINKFMSFVGAAAQTGMEIGNAALNGVANAILNAGDILGDDLNMDPTIRPIVDLSEVEKSADSIASLFNKSIGVTVDKASAASGSIVAKKASEKASTEESSKSSGGNTYNFNQYNNSPKPLSRIEIYRNTKNQFAQFKEAVET